MLLRVASGVLCSVAANVYIYYGRVYSICFLTLRFALLSSAVVCLFVLFFRLYWYMQGVLKGFDQRVNLILDKSVERVFSSEQGVQFEPLGLYIIRGDAVVTVGEIDEVSLKWKKKKKRM